MPSWPARGWAYPDWRADTREAGCGFFQQDFFPLAGLAFAAVQASQRDFLLQPTVLGGDVFDVQLAAQAAAAAKLLDGKSGGRIAKPPIKCFCEMMNGAAMVRGFSRDGVRIGRRPGNEKQFIVRYSWRT
jgi:hypothetical protein